MFTPMPKKKTEKTGKKASIKKAKKTAEKSKHVCEFC